MRGDLKEQVRNWRDSWQIIVPVKSKAALIMYRYQKFKLQEENKLQVDLKNLAHYTLLWIVCVDNYYKMYKMPKVKNSRFLERMDWKGEERYQNVKFMHNWHLMSEQILKELIMEPGRFLIEVCLRG